MKTKFEQDLENEEVIEMKLSLKWQVKSIVLEIEKEFDKKQQRSSKLDELKEELTKNPQDLNLRYSLAQAAFESGVYDQAIQACLDVIKFQFGFNIRLWKLIVIGKIGRHNNSYWIFLENLEQLILLLLMVGKRCREFYNKLIYTYQ